MVTESIDLGSGRESDQDEEGPLVQSLAQKERESGREEEREGTKSCSSHHTISVLKQCLLVVKCNLISGSILYICMQNCTTHMQPQDEVTNSHFTPRRELIRKHEI